MLLLPIVWCSHMAGTTPGLRNHAQTESSAWIIQAVWVSDRPHCGKDYCVQPFWAQLKGPESSLISCILSIPTHTQTHTLISHLKEAELFSWTVSYMMSSTTLSRPIFLYLYHKKNQPKFLRLNCVFMLCRCGCVYQPWLDSGRRRKNEEEQERSHSVSQQCKSSCSTYLHK